MKRFLALFLFAVQLFFGASIQAAEPLKIVATIKPVHSLVSLVVGSFDAVELKLLLDAHADPHHFSLRPSQAKMLEEADIVFMAHPQLELFLQKQAANQKKKYMSLFASVEGNEGGTHDWLNPEIARRSLPFIRKALGQSESAPDSTAIEALFQQKIDGWKKVMKPVAGKELWSNSPALEPFGQAFGLKVLPLNTERMQHNSPHCVIMTHGTNAHLASFAKQHQHHVIRPDILGNTLPAGSQQYFQLMDALVKDISDCLA